MQNVCSTKILPQLNFTNELTIHYLTMNFESWIIIWKSCSNYFDDDSDNDSMLMIMMITFQDCEDYSKTDSHASAQCRNSAQTQASLKTKRYHNNDNRDLCIDDNKNGDSCIMITMIKTASPTEKQKRKEPSIVMRAIFN